MFVPVVGGAGVGFLSASVPQRMVPLTVSAMYGAQQDLRGYLHGTLLQVTVCVMGPLKCGEFGISLDNNEPRLK